MCWKASIFGFYTFFAKYTVDTRQSNGGQNTLRGRSPSGRVAKMTPSHKCHVGGSVPVTFTAAEKGRGKTPTSVVIKIQGCQRLKGIRILKGCIKSGTGLLKRKGNEEAGLQRKHLQKAKLRRQVLFVCYCQEA